MTERPVVKRTARAVLLDGDDLILIKRTKPGVDPYWLTPGGGVEPEDATVVEALHRELDEELGAARLHPQLRAWHLPLRREVEAAPHPGHEIAPVVEVPVRDRDRVDLRPLGGFA